MTSTPETPNDENIAQTVRDLALHLGESEDLSNASGLNPLHEARLIALPDGRKVEDITRFMRDAAEYLKPARRRGTANLADLDSLIHWANRFKGETSALFAAPNMSAPSLTCIADYHAEGGPEIDSLDGDPTARHLAHRGVYAFPLSDEWQAWMAVSKGDPLDKDAMGEFIEANAKDIMDPTPAILAATPSEDNEPWENRLIATARQIDGRFAQLAQLLALSRRFLVLETSDLKLVSNRDTGEREIQFLNEHKDADGAPIHIPNLIIIAIPVFQNGALYRMPVRFRYRKRGASVVFTLSVYNPEKAFKAAFDEAVTHARDETGLPLFLGTPEA